MASASGREGFLADWPAKVLSFAAALLLFFFYRLNRLEERFVSVPLEVRVNEEYVPATPYPRSVRLTLRGESSALFTILEDDFTATADLASFREEGPARAAVRVERRGGAAEVDPLEISVDPPEVAVALERKATRLVPVTPSFRGFLPPGYELVTYEVSPAEVEVSGPSGAVSRVADVSTDFIELAGRTADFSSRARLIRKDPLVEVAGPESAEFSAVVREAIGLKSFEAVELSVEGLAEGLAVEAAPPPGSLRVRSTKAGLAAFEAPPGSLVVDASAARRPGTWTLPVSPRLPEGVAADAFFPDTVTIRIVSREGRTP